MPTPFYHLSLAQDLLDHPSLPPRASQLLRNQQPAFYFGSTAPDVQVVSGQRREETHFYRIPLDRPDPAWKRMLELHPELKPAAIQADERASFLAGYLCHLQADQRWLTDIFLPYFGPDGRWYSFSQRLYLHNVLRSYLDMETIPGLPPGIHQVLQRVRPGEWLPFVEDRDLITWRDFLARQLEPGAEIETVDVFAKRQGISREAYYQVIESEEEMDRQVFSILPREKLTEYRQAVLAENLQLLSYYIEPQGVQTATSRRVETR